MFDVTKNMKNKIKCAETLGMSDDEIAKTFIDRNQKKIIII